MMFNPRHFGLYFTTEHIEQARKGAANESFRAAWALLRDTITTEPLAKAQLSGLRYRFDDDLLAGRQCVDLLPHINLNEDAPYIESVARVITAVQCFEMVRDHPDFTHQTEWLAGFSARLQSLNQPVYELMHFERLWLNLLNLAAGIVQEDEDRFQQAVEHFKETIRQDVHPEGYIPKAVENSDGEGLYRMLLSAQALILTAEAAAHAGEDLWAYDHRSVSAVTPTPYLLYYYYYPEKWRWDASLEKETAQALYRHHSGFWEMAQRRVPSHDRRLLLNELRPVYDVWGGGITTLTHGGEAVVKRRGLFR